MEDQIIDVPKTKVFKSILKALKLEIDKALFITGNVNDNAVSSARNIPNAKVISANELSTYELVNADYIVLFESAIDTIENRLN